METNIRSRALSAAVALCVAVAGLLAVGALASASAQASQWYAGPEVLEGSAGYSATMGETNFEKGEFAGQEVKAVALEMQFCKGSCSTYRITASGAEAFGSSLITNEAPGHLGIASGTGRIRLTGVKVSSPSTCKVKENRIETKEFSSEVVSLNGHTYLKMSPFAFTLTLEKGTGACAMAGSTSVTGSLYARADGLGGPATDQKFSFSNAISTETQSGLVGAGAQVLLFEGSLLESLTGAHSGQTWQVK